MGKKSTKVFETTLVKELEVSGHLNSRHDTNLSRSDVRRTVEDLLEIKRYKAMHDDFYDF